MPNQAAPVPKLPPIDDKARRRVARALGEVRRGAAVVLQSGADQRLVVALEHWGDVTNLADRQGPAVVTLALSDHRRQALGLPAPDRGTGQRIAAYHLPLSALDRAFARYIADPTGAAGPIAVPAGLDPVSLAGAEADLAQDAVDLARLARLTPAVAMLPVKDAPAALLDEGTIALPVDLLRAYRAAPGAFLKRVGEARVPLAGAEQTRIIAYRPFDGGEEHLAVIIGTPDLTRPVLARLHSSCITGDVLGSLRCDCGDQLRGGVAAIAAAGGGILLYLTQEGRGIGIAGKLRAYALQDRGLDTLDANRHLGFEADERNFTLAAEMLRDLGVGAVRLMTNNPEKLAVLSAAGVTVTERVPHSFPPNPHNAGYLQTKRSRAGHMIDL